MTDAQAQRQPSQGQQNQQNKQLEEQAIKAYENNMGKAAEDFVNKNRDVVNRHINRMKEKLTIGGKDLDDAQAREVLKLWIAFLLKAGVPPEKIREYLENANNPVVGSKAFIEKISNEEFGKNAQKALSEIGTTEFRSGVTGREGKDFYSVLNDASGKSFNDFYNAHKNDRWLERSMQPLGLDPKNEEHVMAFLYWLWKIAQLKLEEKEGQPQPPPQPPQQESRQPREDETPPTTPPTTPPATPPPTPPPTQAAPPTQQTTQTYDLTTKKGRKSFAENVLLLEKTKKELENAGVNIKAYEKAVEKFIESGRLELYFLHSESEKVGKRKIDRVREKLMKKFEGIPNVKSQIVPYDSQKKSPQVQQNGQTKPADLLIITVPTQKKTVAEGNK